MKLGIRHFAVVVLVVTQLGHFVSPVFGSERYYISSISPSEVAVTEMVTLDGFFGILSGSVYLNNREISVYLWSEKRIQFRIPADTMGGTASIRVEFYHGWQSALTDSIYVRGDIQPIISSISPETVNIGDTVTIFGANLSNNIYAASGGTHYLQVYVGATPIGKNYIGDWTDNYIRIVVPSFVQTGQLRIVVSDEYGKSLEAYGPSLQVLQPISNDPLSSFQTYLRQAHVPEAWAYADGGKNIVVAVIDSGINTNEPDITDSVWTNSGEIPGNKKDDDRNGYVDDVHGYDFENQTGEMTPIAGHGTMVAGIIAATKDNAINIAGIANIRILPIIVGGGNGILTSNVVKAIKYATDEGALIINLSLGGPGWTDDYNTAYDSAIKYAYDHGVLIVAAAGNGDVRSHVGVNLDINPTSPACNDGGANMVLGVGSVDANDRKSIFSNYGSSCVDVVAPGEAIVTTADRYFSSLGVTFDVGTGTSFAAPIVTGIAALIKGRCPALTNSQIIERIRNTADSITASNDSFYFGRLGAGRVNALRAVTEPCDRQDAGLSNDGTASIPSIGATTALMADYLPAAKPDANLISRMKGRILLQVERNGEAWYVHPDDGKRYYMKDGPTAYEMMRRFGQGITDADLAKIPAVESAEEMNASTSACSGYALANRMRGNILLQVQQHGEAWYVEPTKCRRIYLRDGSAAYSVMRLLSLGISDDNLSKIPAGTF